MPSMQDVGSSWWFVREGIEKSASPQSMQYAAMHEKPNV